MAIRPTAPLAGALLWLFAAQFAAAETVKLVMPNGSTATADYEAAAPSRPAVLLLHGFLQTRYAATIQGLKDSLAAAGYNVLTPTLTLGIDNRRRSLACEAVHTHDMDEDKAEIDAWVHWLRNRGHQQVVLIGHSFGSLQILSYVLDRPDPAVQRAIATSLVDLEHGTGASATAAEVERARTMIARGDQSLSAFEISYCKRYVAPPGPFLSYAEWSKDRILRDLPQVKVRLDVIMGSSDQRMDADWPSMLANHGVRVAMIEGANHFFDGVHELELTETTLTLLQEASAP